jgi:hypothetical protein
MKKNRKIVIGIGVVVLLFGLVVYAVFSTPPSYNIPEYSPGPAAQSQAGYTLYIVVMANGQVVETHRISQVLILRNDGSWLEIIQRPSLCVARANLPLLCFHSNRYYSQREILSNGWACDQPVSGHLQFRVTVDGKEQSAVYYPWDTQQIGDEYLVLVGIQE